jgi:hypothetical protein
VLEDVKQGYVSLKCAEEKYGVVVDEKRMAEDRRKIENEFGRVARAEWRSTLTVTKRKIYIQEGIGFRLKRATFRSRY